MSTSIVMPEPTPRLSVDDWARLHVLEACLEALTAENEILKHRLEFLQRRLASAETRAAEETVKAKWAIAQFSDLSRRVRSTQAPDQRWPARGGASSSAEREADPAEVRSAASAAAVA